MQKKKRIVDSGGTRPRSMASNERSSNFRQTAPPELARRFGRVMEQAPCRNVPRFSTVSIAIPGSIVTNCQTKELQTILCGQLARMATIYHVDEIIVYNDQLSHTRPQSSDRPRNRPPRESENGGNKNQEEVHHSANDPQVFMGRILQYCECPQYLRRHFFPLHADLQYTGLLPPMDAPHHVRAQDRSPYREGVVLSQLPPNSGSLVNCGIRNRPVQYVRYRALASFDIFSYVCFSYFLFPVVNFFLRTQHRSALATRNSLYDTNRSRRVRPPGHDSWQGSFTIYHSAFRWYLLGIYGTDCCLSEVGFGGLPIC